MLKQKICFIFIRYKDKARYYKYSTWLLLEELPIAEENINTNYYIIISISMLKNDLILDML